MDARKPRSSFPKVRARTKRPDCDAVVRVKDERGLDVVERRPGGRVEEPYQVLLRGEGKKQGEGDDLSLLGAIEYRKRKRGR